MCSGWGGVVGIGLMWEGEDEGEKWVRERNSPLPDLDRWSEPFQRLGRPIRGLGRPVVGYLTVMMMSVLPTFAVTGLLENKFS